MGTANNSEDLELYTTNANDPDHKLFKTDLYPPEVMDHVNELMTAMGKLREAEREISESSRAYMKLNATDMRALHFIMARQNQRIDTTPSQLAAHLEITTASITKLLDRLEAASHISRHPHPTDRRAMIITVAPSTKKTAMHTVGKHQATRLGAAISLSHAERQIVIDFLNNTTTDLIASISIER